MERTCWAAGRRDADEWVNTEGDAAQNRGELVNVIPSYRPNSGDGYRRIIDTPW